MKKVFKYSGLFHRTSSTGIPGNFLLDQRRVSATRYKESECGQALIFIVFVFIGLLGFVGLAIDGGRLFSERRQSQSASDNASLAAARALCIGQDLVSAALSIANSNGFDNNGSTNTITIHRPPISGQYIGDANSIEVIIDSNLPGSFISLVYPGPIQVNSRSVSRCTPSHTSGVGDGNAIITLYPTQSGSLSLTGNGNVTVTSGGIFVNSNASSAMRLTGNGNVHADSISIVGGWTKTGNGTATPTPTIHVAPMTDPLVSVPPPTQPGGSCTTISLTDNNDVTIDPGYYCSISLTGNGSLIMNPGIYYIQNGLSATGNGNIVAHNAMIYCKTGSFSLTGNGNFDVTAPTTGDYAGMALFMDRANTSAVRLTGNGNSTSTGTIYAAASPITLTGNGSSSVMNSQVIANTITTTGNGNINVNYVPGQNYQITYPPTIDLLE